MPRRAPTPLARAAGRFPAVTALALLAALGGAPLACARGIVFPPVDSAAPPPDGADPADATGTDAHSLDVRDAPRLDAVPPPDVAGRDVPRSDAPRTDAPLAGGLDPALATPPGTAAACTRPGSLSECAGIEVCRFYSAAEGRCEGCSACGNLGAACSDGTDCDILFVCFRGRCTNFCTLGSSECGPPDACVDVGHPTRGACRP